MEHKETRETLIQIDDAFLELTLNLIRECIKNETRTPEMIKETRECFKLIRELGF